MTASNQIKIGISHGDTNGIGYEVILKTLMNLQILELCTPIIYGSRKISSIHKKSINLENYQFNFINEAKEAKANQANFIDLIKEEIPVEYGVATKESGFAAFKSLEKAVNDLKNGLIDVLITAPINKDNIQSENFNFPGHTEYLAFCDEKKDSLMFLVSDNLKVAVVTGHIPLKDISANLSSEKIFDKIIQVENALKLDFNVRKPKIAVLGLNPHAGDNGLLGSEDLEIILPAINQAKEKDILAFGPYSADGFFGSGNYKNFDAVLAMYHDQGLIPFKTLAFGEGTNFTAGLSFIRTSPDHGTGNNIAGQNIADESSFRQALFCAIDIFKSRELNIDLLKNQLKRKPQKFIKDKVRNEIE